jgi:hypothetical protein
MNIISKTWLPSIIYIIIPLIIYFTTFNLQNNDKINRLYYLKHCFSYKQDILNNRIPVIITIILSIIGGILLYKYVYYNYNFKIRILVILFILFYIFEFAIPFTNNKFTFLHAVLFTFLCIFGILTLIILVSYKNKIIKLIGYLLIFISLILILISGYIINRKIIVVSKDINKSKYCKLETYLLLSALIIIGIVIYLIGIE